MYLFKSEVADNGVKLTFRDERDGIIYEHALWVAEQAVEETWEIMAWAVQMAEEKFERHYARLDKEKLKCQAE